MGSIPSKDPPPPSDGAKALILVVGNDTEYKSRVVGALADAIDATHKATTKAGVRVFTRKSKDWLPPPVVLDTVPLKTAENWRPADIARVWITQNSLRRLSGKLVFVVCVIAPTDSVYQQPDVERNSFNWLSVLASIFEQHKQEIMILVNSEDNADKASRLELREVLKRDGFTETENIIFASVREGVDLILRHMSRSTVDLILQHTSTVAPFRLPEVAPNASDKEKFGPWGPENLILFGRSGSGKSTLAQMFTLGRLDAVHKKFSCSSGIRRETRTVNEGQGRGWRVIDTPGLGEPNDDAESTVSTDKAAKLILDHVLLVEGTYCHFLYVWKKSRVEDLDSRLWKVFVKVVGSDRIKDHTTIVISDADEDWLDRNVTRLRECFEGCESFLTANFPPIPPDDDEYENDLQEMRLESLEALEDELASVGLIDAGCKLGEWSRGTQRSRMVRGADCESALIVRPAIRQSSAFGPSATEEKHPSDYEAARSYIKLNSVWSVSVLLPSRKLDLRDDSVSFTTSARIGLKQFWKRRSMGNIPSKDPPPAPDGAKALILVVGNDTEYKSRVVGALADAIDATHKATTKAGVRVFTRKSKDWLPPPVVLDTVPLKTAENWRPADIARVWITQNSLRRLSGKLVFVVCVIAPTDSVYQQPDVERNSFNWLSVLASIFEQHKQEIMILVNSEDNADKASRLELREVLKRDGFTETENIIFASVREGVDLILRHMSRSTVDLILQHTSTVAPFRLPEVAPNASDKEKFGPWGPENLILFGRSGSGKSTLAQMFTLGRLDAVHKKFSCSSGIRRETRTVNEGQGRGWRVIDTPGLGEPNDDAESTVSTDKAAKLILDHVLLVEGTYCHFLYVWKKSRVEDLDSRLWKVFVKVVGSDRIKDHTTIVISDADEDWLDRNVTRLRECFEGCESFLTANFPPIPPDDDEYENDLQEMRLESLEALEDELASVGLIDAGCKLGEWSRGTQRSRMVRGADCESALIVRPAIRQSSAFGPSATEEKHPSDYEAARSYIKLHSVWSVSVLLPPRKLYWRDVSVSFTISARILDDESGLTNDSLKGKKEAKLAITSSPVLEPVTNTPGTPGTLNGSPDKVKDSLNYEERAKTEEDQEASEDDPDPVLGTPKCTSGIVYSAEDFRREIDEGGEDGYFVSSNWLLNLEEHERENLMSVLRGAGYSETRQMYTTTLFARLVNDRYRQNLVPVDGEPRSSTNIDEDGAPEGGDDLFGIGIRGLNADLKSVDIDDVCDSDNSAETSSSIYLESRTFEDGITEEMSPVAGEQRAARWSNSFQAAPDSKSHQSFYVSTKLLSNLKDREREALEAGYEKIRERQTTTWYEKITGRVKNPTGEDRARDNDPSKSSNGNDITGGAVKEPATSERGAFLGKRQNVNDEDGSSNSSFVEITTETRQIQDRHSTCHPQLLSVKLCTSTSQTPMDLPAAIGTRKQLLGDSIVEMPETDGSQNISTSIERPFKLKAMSFPDGECHREVLLNLKAIASMTLSCCVRVDPHQAKVRFKISRISGEVKNEESSEEEEEKEGDLCHEMVLSSLYTTVYGYMKSPTGSNIPSGQIFLNLDDEYFHLRRRRVLASAEQSEGDSTASADLLWLEISGTSTNRSHTGFTGLVLRGDINGRRKDEEKREVRLAEPLLFHEPRPVIVEGDIQEYHPNSFIEFHITHKLEYSYFKLSRGRHYRAEGPVWAARHETKAVDFGCCLEMKTKGLLTQRRMKSTPI